MGRNLIYKDPENNKSKPSSNRKPSVKSMQLSMTENKKERIRNIKNNLPNNKIASATTNINNTGVKNEQITQNFYN